MSLKAKETYLKRLEGFPLTVEGLLASNSEEGELMRNGDLTISELVQVLDASYKKFGGVEFEKEVN